MGEQVEGAFQREKSFGAVRSILDGDTTDAPRLGYVDDDTAHGEAANAKQVNPATGVPANLILKDETPVRSYRRRNKTGTWSLTAALSVAHVTNG